LAISLSFKAVAVYSTVYVFRRCVTQPLDPISAKACEFVR